MKLIKLIAILTCFFTSCNASESEMQPITDQNNSTENEMENIETLVVQNVSFSGEEGNYTVSVTLKSPDTGCNQYADWWEIVTEEEELIYRRILAHSHVNEQPFSRSGSGIVVQTNQILIIRGHMNNTGYSNSALKGSIESGFEAIELEDDFASNLSETEPLPDGCAF